MVCRVEAFNVWLQKDSSQLFQVTTAGKCPGCLQCQEIPKPAEPSWRQPWADGNGCLHPSSPLTSLMLTSSLMNICNVFYVNRGIQRTINPPILLSLICDSWSCFCLCCFAVFFLDGFPIIHHPKVQLSPVLSFSILLTYLLFAMPWLSFLQFPTYSTKLVYYSKLSPYYYCVYS